MAFNEFDATPSRAAIAGHPIHPMLVPFPIAFLVGALVVDVVFASTGNVFWAEAGFWLLAAGIVMGALAAVFGLVDFLSLARVRALNAAWMHFLGNGAAMVLAIWNLAQRWGDPATGASGLGIALSAIVVAILLVTGWLGGELSYRYRIGVMSEAERRPEQAIGATPAYAAEKPNRQDFR
jgi:uncharacterized membrane protein